MPVNLVFQISLDNYPWDTLVWDGCRFAAASFPKCPHFSINVANVFAPFIYLNVDWYYNIIHFI